MTSYRIAADIAWVNSADLGLDGEPTTYVTRPPFGPAMVLTGSAYVVWMAIAEGGTLEDIVATVSVLTGAQRHEVAPDVAQLIDDLVSVGVVRPG